MKIIVCFARCLVFIPILLLLVACGGGGGGDSPAVPANTSGNGFSISTNSLSFVGVQNASPPGAQDIYVSVTHREATMVGAAYPPGVPAASWLSTTASGSGTSYTLRFTVNATNLTPGTHTTTISIGIARSDGSIIDYRNVSISYQLHALGNPGTGPGSLDGSFGAGGVVTFNNTVTSPTGTGSDTGEAIAVDGSGRVVVTGFTTTYGGYGAMGLWRFNANGSPDTSFGDLNGSARSGFTFYNRAAGGGSTDAGAAVTIDGSGRILVAGYGYNASESHTDMVVWRYLNNGTLDASFGNGGIAVQRDAAGAGRDSASTIAIDGSGRILVAGTSTNSAGNLDMVVWRLTDNGSLDMTFGGDYNGSNTPDGFVIVDGAAFAGSNDFANDIQLDASGRIVVAGSSGLSDHDMVVWRFTANGQLDTSFGVDYDTSGTRDGFFKHNGATAANSHDTAGSLAIDGVGRIVLAGGSYNATSGYDMVIWRLTTDGVLDTAFGGGQGYITYDRADDSDIGRSVAIDSVGRILVAGYTTVMTTTHEDVTLWRYDTNGALDSGYGNGGIAIYDTPPAWTSDSDRVHAMTLDGSGRAVATGSSTLGGATHGDLMVYRFLP